MKAPLLLISFVLLTLVANAQSTFVRLVTNKGNITLMLYDSTPKHRDMFIDGIRKGLYTDAQFNRVIKSFVSQGGELDETILDREKQHPEIPVQRLDAEIKPDLFHKKGALGAGRNDNPEKSSYLTQIYLVEGKKITDEELDALEDKKKTKFSDLQRQIYKTIGGCPRLDGDYTVFGEIVKGMDVAEAINSVATNQQDLPLATVKFSAKVLSKKESLEFRKYASKKRIK